MKMRIDVDYLKRELGISVEHFSVIDSTMNYVNNLVNQRKRPPDAVIADHQTNGVGRVGRGFYSPDSTGLYLTLVYDESYFPDGDITPRIALAVRDAIFSVFGISCGIKWVNDLYINGRKVCGILCRKLDRYISIGIGINVEEPKSVPEDLIDRFGSLVKQCDRMNYTSLVKEIYSSCRYWSECEKNIVLSEYRNCCNHIEKDVILYQNNKKLFGKCIDISEDFSIVVEIDNKYYSFSSGEISLKI